MDNKPEYGYCPGGSWGNCPNARSTYVNGWQTMRCTLSGEHPDNCHNYSRAKNKKEKTKP